MKEFKMSFGTQGQSYEVELSRPETPEEYVAAGYTDDSINAMLHADDCRRIAALGRTLCNENGDLTCSQEEVVEKLNAYVYIPGRKGGGGKRASKVRQEERQNASDKILSLTPSELKKLQALSDEDRLWVVSQEDWSAAITQVG